LQFVAASLLLLLLQMFYDCNAVGCQLQNAFMMHKHNGRARPFRGSRSIPGGPGVYCPAAMKHETKNLKPDAPCKMRLAMFYLIHESHYSFYCRCNFPIFLPEIGATSVLTADRYGNLINH